MARQVGAATDPLTRQLEKLCDRMLELRRGASRRNQEISAPVQGPSRPRGKRFNNQLSSSDGPETEVNFSHEIHVVIRPHSSGLFAQFFIIQPGQ